MSFQAEKAQLRAEARAVIAALSPTARLEQAARLVALILASPEWQAAARLLLFVPLPDEINLSPLISAALNDGKRVALPSFHAETGCYLAREIKDPVQDLVPGRFEILEPGPQCRRLPISELDYLLVPGLAFDASGGRLGRGKGFYDRLLTQATGRILGAGFIEQLGPKIPIEPHDRRLHGVITAAGFKLSQRAF